MGHKKNITNFALIFVSLVVSLVLLEILLRFLEPFPRGVMELNEKYIYSPQKNIKSKYRHFPQNGGRVIPLKFNNMGFRGEDFSVSKNNKKRIVVYGDSFIQASYVNQTETFSKQLEHKLGQKLSSTIEVVNAGVSGYGPDQILLKMENEVDWLNPDFLIVSLYAGNDFGDLFRNNLFRLTADDQLIQNKIIISKVIREKYKRKQKEAESFELQKLVMRLSDTNWVRDRLYPFVKGWLGLSIKNNEASYIDRILNTGMKEYETYKLNDKESDDVPVGDHYDADLSIEPDSESSKLKINLMDKIIGRISTYTKERNIPLLFLIIPSPIDVCENFDFQVDESIYKKYEREYKTSIIESLVKKYKINYINLFKYFNNKQCNKIYFNAGNNHWNAKGQERAAELMADGIVNSLIFN